MKKIVTIAFAVLAMAACTNLDEQLYSQISKEEFMKHDEVIAQYADIASVNTTSIPPVPIPNCRTGEKSRVIGLLSFS